MCNTVNHSFIKLFQRAAFRAPYYSPVRSKQVQKTQSKFFYIFYKSTTELRHLLPSQLTFIILPLKFVSVFLFTHTKKLKCPFTSQTPVHHLSQRNQTTAYLQRYCWDETVAELVGSNDVMLLIGSPDLMLPHRK